MSLKLKIKLKGKSFPNAPPPPLNDKADDLSDDSSDIDHKKEKKKKKKKLKKEKKKKKDKDASTDNHTNPKKSKVSIVRTIQSTSINDDEEEEVLFEGVKPHPAAEAPKVVEKPTAVEKPKVEDEKPADEGKTSDPSTKKKKEDLVCVCKKVFVPNDFMLGCEDCDDWFHPKCIGYELCARQDHTKSRTTNCLKITPHRHVDTNEGSFICPSCTRSGYAHWKEKFTGSVTEVTDRKFYFEKLHLQQLQRDELKRLGKSESEATKLFEDEQVKQAEEQNEKSDIQNDTTAVNKKRKKLAIDDDDEEYEEDEEVKPRQEKKLKTVKDPDAIKGENELTENQFLKKQEEKRVARQNAKIKPLYLYQRIPLSDQDKEKAKAQINFSAWIKIKPLEESEKVKPRIANSTLKMISELSKRNSKLENLSAHSLDQLWKASQGRQQAQLARERVRKEREERLRQARLQEIEQHRLEAEKAKKERERLRLEAEEKKRKWEQQQALEREKARAEERAKRERMVRENSTMDQDQGMDDDNDDDEDDWGFN